MSSSFASVRVTPVALVKDLAVHAKPLDAEHHVQGSRDATSEKPRAFGDHVVQIL